MSGMDFMLQAAAKHLASNLPPEVLEKVDQIGRTVADFASRLDRIEAKQELIIQTLTEIFNHGQDTARSGSVEQRNVGSDTASRHVNGNAGQTAGSSG